MALKRQTFYENFIINLERERNALNLTQTQMAEHLGMSTSGYKKMIAGGTSKIDIYTALRMYQITGKLLCELCEENDPYLELAKKLRRLSPSQRSFINGLVDFELELTVPPSDTVDTVDLFIPTGNFDDGMFWDSANVKKINVAAYRKRFGERIHCGILVTSNHLHPVYHFGDVLLVCRKAPRDGDTGIFINKLDGRAYLRKFFQKSPCVLEPVNDQGVTFYVDSYDEKDMDRWIKFGYVLTKMRQDNIKPL